MFLRRVYRSFPPVALTGLGFRSSLDVFLFQTTIPPRLRLIVLNFALPFGPKIHFALSTPPLPTAAHRSQRNLLLRFLPHER